MAQYYWDRFSSGVKDVISGTAEKLEQEKEKLTKQVKSRLKRFTENQRL